MRFLSSTDVPFHCVESTLSLPEFSIAANRAPVFCGCRLPYIRTFNLSHCLIPLRDDQEVPSLRSSVRRQPFHLDSETSSEIACQWPFRDTCKPSRLARHAGEHLAKVGDQVRPSLSIKIQSSEDRRHIAGCRPLLVRRTLRANASKNSR